MTTLKAEPQVADYLLRLRVASARLPRDEAAELRDQILEHLSEVIDEHSTATEIATVLKQLGSPAGLAAETLDAKPRGWRPWVRARRWWTWAIVVVTLAGIGSGIGYVVTMAEQPALQGNGGTYGWYVSVDSKSAKELDNISSSESITAIRPGHLQGFVVTLHNPSSWPETVEGVQASSLSIGSPSPPTIAVGSANADAAGDFNTTPFLSVPVTIPPGQYRLARVTWRSATCFLGEGGSEGTNNLFLRVKIGWFTHNQTITLPLTWALSGKPFPRTCPSGN